MAMIICGFYTLCGLIRLAYFNVLEEERQKLETTGRKYYTGLPITSAALIFPLAFVATNHYLLDNRLILITTLALTAVAFVLPIRIKKPYFAGKLVMVFTGLVEFVILLISVGLN